MEKRNELSDVLTMKIVEHLGKQKNNLAVIKHYGTFSLTAENAKDIMMNYPEVNTYYHHFANEDMVQSFEPFLNIINNIYSRYYYKISIEEFLDKFNIYKLQKSFFKSYLEDGVCLRNEPFILDEVEYEQKKMMQSVANILIELSKKHPIFIMINNLQTAAKSTIAFLKYLYTRDDNDSIGIFAAYNDLKPIIPCNVQVWEEYITLLNSGGLIYEGGAYQVSKGEENQVFRFDNDKVFDYITKLKMMFYALDFEQAEYYLENIYSKIEYERMHIDYKRKLELYKLYAWVALYMMDIPIAQRVCDKIKDIFERYPSMETEYEYYRLLSYSYIYGARLDKGRETVEKCKQLALKLGDEKLEFEADMLGLVLEMSGFRSTVFFFGENIQISEEILEKAHKYQYYNHLAYTYIFAYCNEVDDFQKITGVEKIDEVLIKFAEGITLAESIGNTFLVLKGYRKNIMLSSTHGMFYVAKYYYYKCQEITDVISEVGMADNNNGLGYILCTEHNYEQANESYNRALDVYMKADMVDYIGETLYNMSINCILANDMSSAYSYLLLCIKIIETLKLNDLRVCNIAKICGLLALCSIRLLLEYNCILYLDTSKRFLSQFFSKDGDDLLDKKGGGVTGSDDELFLYFYSRGLLAVENGDYKKALAYYLKAEKNCYQSIGNQFFSLIMLKMSMGELYDILGDTKKRDAQYQEAYNYAKEHNYEESIRDIEAVINEGKPYKPTKHKIPLLKYKLEDINAKNSNAGVSRQFADVKNQLEYVSVWQNILENDGKSKRELIENASNAFMLNFSLDSFVFIKYDKYRGEVLFNNGCTKLSDAELKFLRQYFEKHRVGFVVSNLSKNYNDYIQILDIFGENHICSMVCNPFFVNEKLDSLFVSCVHIKENWNIRKTSYLFAEREYDIFSILLRQLLNAIDKLETIDEIRHMNDELKKSSVTDYLTGLRNRQGFYTKMHQLVSRGSHNGEGTGVSILYVDLDNFKYYNDTFGHDVGDLILKEVAMVLNNAAGKDGFATRYGGDEFIITLINRTKKNAMATAKLTLDVILSQNGYVSQISNFLGKQVSIPRNKNVTCSIGVACSDNVSTDADLTELINNADKALYDIKNSTKNGIMFYEES